MANRATGRSPDRDVLLPPEEAPPPPLPRWVLPLALLGLAVLASSAIPAVLEHARLERWHARLVQETRRQEQEVVRLSRRLRSARTDRYVREKELERLLHPRAERLPGRAAAAAPGGGSPPVR